MTFHIGVFRLDSSSFRSQVVYFKDVSGLTQKADVKIAGVKVGWVEDIALVQGDNEYQARAQIRVNKKYTLRSDACAVVRQDGLLGNKYLEVTPGDSTLPPLRGGASFGAPGKPPASVDDILQEFKSIATNIDEVTGALRKAISDKEGKVMLQETFQNIHSATDKIASFADIIERIASRNEDDIQGIISDFRAFAGDMREVIPGLKEDIHQVAQRLDSTTLPAFERNVERIGNVFDRDFGGIADKLESTADAIEEAALQTRDGFRTINSVAEKINDGKGLIGKLINEDETYQDLKVAVAGLKNYFSEIESLGIVFDSHFENMYGRAEHFALREAKGYFDVRVHPSEDHFYVLQAMGSMKGSIKRTVMDERWFDGIGNEYFPSLMLLADTRKLEHAPRKEITIRTRDTTRYGFQFGKSFSDIAFRFGLIDGSFGAGVDYDIPFRNDSFRWVTTFEAFDMRGRERIEDQSPHLKWLNRVFLFNNFYVNFGVDDFVSKKNINSFFGIGLRFADDDMKYFISRLGLTGFGVKN